MVFFARMQEGEIIRKTENKYKLDKHWTTILNQFKKLKPEQMTPLLETFKAQILFEKAQQEAQKYLDVQISGPKGGSTSQRAIDKALKSQLRPNKMV